jgi:hypothetical protein
VLARISGYERGICFLRHWKVPRQSALAKPSEMNTYTKMGGGVPRCGSTEIWLTGISS